LRISDDRGQTFGDIIDLSANATDSNTTNTTSS